MKLCRFRWVEGYLHRLFVGCRPSEWGELWEAATTSCCPGGDISFADTGEVADRHSKCSTCRATILSLAKCNSAACQPATSITEVAGDSAEVSDKPADSTGRRPVGFDVGVLFERGVQPHGGRLGSCHDQETKKPRRSGARRQVVQA